MQYFRSILIALLFLLLNISAKTQSFSSSEDSIRVLLKLISETPDDSIKVQLNKTICSVFEKILPIQESFSYPFDSLKHFGRLTTDDKLVRIITWNIILSDGTNLYSGFIQKRNINTLKVFELTDKADEVTLKETSVLSAGKWFGAIYYKLIPKKINQTPYYTILALRYNDLFTTSKIIEILYFDEFENPVFGAPLFDDNNKIKLRRVFDYSAKVAMNLNYRDDLKMIVFDHLSPGDPRYTEQVENYGPDLSFDGYQFKGNKWKLISDVNLNPTVKPNKSTTKKKTPVSNKIIKR